MALDVISTWTPAGPFGQACQTAVLDLRPHVKDEVLRNLPVFIGRWEDGTTTKLILEENYQIETSESDCEPSVASSETKECTVILPDQKLVSIGFAELPYRDTMKKFCTPLGITKFPTLFDRSGNFVEGTKQADRFIVYILGSLRRVFMKSLRDSAWTGNQTIRHQYEGMLRQLTNGPFSSGAGCELYRAPIIDWNTWTGGTGTSAPSATIAAGQTTQTILGNVFTGLAGKNMGEFIRDWIERLRSFDLVDFLAENNIRVEFELWIPIGSSSCITDLLACMQPCQNCSDPMSDPTIRARAAEFRRNRVVWVFPYDNIPIKILESPALVNTYVFRPAFIEGAPTVGWVFRDQQEEMNILEGELPWFGTDIGLPEPDGFHMADEIEAGQFQQRAFSLHLQRNGNCIEAFLNAEAAIAMFALNSWLVFQNVNCSSLVPVVNTSMSVAVSDCAAVGGQAQQLTLTVAGLEALGIADGVANAGTTLVVYFSDGVTQLIGTVVSYAVATDALVLSFSIAVTCLTGSLDGVVDGPASVTVLQVVTA